MLFCLGVILHLSSRDKNMDWRYKILSFYGSEALSFVAGSILD
jgi:hypothetical protein